MRIDLGTKKGRLGFGDTATFGECEDDEGEREAEEGGLFPFVF